MAIEIETVVSRPFAENSYVVWADGGDEAVVIDPGFEPELIRRVLADRGLGVAALLCTHGHVDHIAGNAALKRAFPAAPVVIGAGDAPMLTDADLNLSGLNDYPVVSPPADRTVAEGDALTYAGVTFEVLDVPGHSPGHVVFVVRQTDPVTVFGGDVLFRGGVGRTDFPGGSFPQLKRHIERVLWPLPAGAVVYPGHGPVTTVGHERRTNPFLT